MLHGEVYSHHKDIIKKLGNKQKCTDATNQVKKNQQANVMQ